MFFTEQLRTTAISLIKTKFVQPSSELCSKPCPALRRIFLAIIVNVRWLAGFWILFSGIYLWHCSLFFRWSAISLSFYALRFSQQTHGISQDLTQSVSTYPQKMKTLETTFLLGPGVHTRLKWRENVLGVIQYGSPFKNPIFSSLLPSYHYLSLSMATPPLSCHYYQTQLFRKRKNTIFVLC